MGVIKIIKKIIVLFRAYTDFKSIFFNFTYFDFRTALKLPVKVSRNTVLKACKGEVIIKEPIYRHMIRIGFGDIGIFDPKRSRAIWFVHGPIVFNGAAYIGQGSKICVGHTGRLVIGEHFRINAESTIIANHYVEFGKHCLLSWKVNIMDMDFHHIYNEEGDYLNPPKPIIFGNRVWLASHSTILKGAKIADGCVVAAGSHVVGKDYIEPKCIIGGHPAKVLKRNIEWKN